MVSRVIDIKSILISLYIPQNFGIKVTKSDDNWKNINVIFDVGSGKEMQSSGER